MISRRFTHVLEDSSDSSESGMSHKSSSVVSSASEHASSEDASNASSSSSSADTTDNAAEEITAHASATLSAPGLDAFDARALEGEQEPGSFEHLESYMWLPQQHPNLPPVVHGAHHNAGATTFFWKSFKFTSVFNREREHSAYEVTCYCRGHKGNQRCSRQMNFQVGDAASEDNTLKRLKWWALQGSACADRTTHMKTPRMPDEALLEGLEEMAGPTHIEPLEPRGRKRRADAI
eukprot:6458320-Amphidinium_carterae.3